MIKVEIEDNEELQLQTEFRLTETKKNVAALER